MTEDSDRCPWPAAVGTRSILIGMPEVPDTRSADDVPSTAMSGQGSLNVGGRVSASAALSGVGTLTVGAAQAAVQELRDSNLEELRRLLDEYLQAYEARDTADIDVLVYKGRDDLCWWPGGVAHWRPPGS